MPIILYQIPASPPCRAVVMAAQHLGIKLDSRLVDLFNQEHLKPEFLAINPQHTVPTIDDNGFYLWDSHAIMAYLVNKYAPDNKIYPKDPQKRAVVDRMFYFDIGNLAKAMFEYVRLHVIQGLPLDQEKKEAVTNAIELLEKFLEKTPYVAGDHLTLADFSIVCTVLFIQEICDYSLKSYPKISAWVQKLRAEIPNFKEINDDPVRQMKENLKSRQK